MTYISNAATDDLNEEMDRFVTPSLHHNRRAVAKEADEGVTVARLRNEPVSVLPEILDLYSENGSENVAELLIAICEEHPQAIIKAGGVDIFRSEIYNTDKELASTIDPWSLRGIQAVAEEEPSEVVEDLQSIGELLKIYISNDKSYEREIYSLVRLLMAIGKEYPNRILTEGPDAVESIIEVIETVEATITVVSGLIALEEIASSIRAGTRSINKYSDQLRPLLWHDNPDVRYYACRLAVYIDFEDIDDRLNELIVPTPIETPSPTEIRIPLAASRALAASRGDRETAEEAARISRVTEEMQIHAVKNQDLLTALDDPNPIIRQHAAYAMSGMKWMNYNYDFLAENFHELIEQQDDQNLKVRGALTMIIVNTIDVCGPNSDKCSVVDVENEKFKSTLDNALPLLNADHPRYFYDGICLLRSVAKRRPRIAKSWFRNTDTPSLTTIIDRSSNRPKFAGIVTIILSKLVVVDPELVAEQKEKVVNLAKTLTKDVFGATSIYKLVVALVVTDAATRDTLDQLVSPVASLLREEDLCKYRLRGCWTLCHLAANLNDPAIPPTIYEEIIDCWPTQLESDHTEVWRMLDGLKTLANHGFVPPDDIIERLIELAHSDVEMDKSSAQADTFGEFAVITLGAIEDESIEGYLQDMQSNDDLPMETRRAVTRVLEE